VSPRAFTQQAPTRQEPSSNSASNTAGVQPFKQPVVLPYNLSADPGAVQPPRTADPSNTLISQAERPTPAEASRPVDGNPARSGSAAGGGTASERARHAARAHYARHGRLPTATELMQLAQVARGTAGTVLKALRREPPVLHLVNANPDQRPDQ
jgi:hypothetical protein